MDIFAPSGFAFVLLDYVFNLATQGNACIGTSMEALLIYRTPLIVLLFVCKTCLECRSAHMQLVRICMHPGRILLLPTRNCEKQVLFSTILESPVTVCARISFVFRMVIFTRCDRTFCESQSFADVWCFTNDVVRDMVYDAYQSTTA